MAARLETTQRDESAHGVAPGRWALQWVWPKARSSWLDAPRLDIGRDASCALSLDGPGVSRKHAELYRQGPLFALRDLGSTNGSWLNGRRVEHAPIASGDVLRIGDWVGMLRMLHELPPAFRELAPGLFGGAEVAAALEPLRRAAGTADLPLLLTGATGTGKERFAHAVHHFSGRRGPFVAVNCAALPEQLAEAELFGYRRGAFTGAERNSIGHLRASDGGTLLLDEVAELPASLQPKLLRALESHNVQGLGEPAPALVDLRVVSAVQRPVAELVESGRLREDLAARLCGLQILLPPLRDRRPDIAGLFGQFLRQNLGGRIPRVEGRVVEALCLHDWPQNVRALELSTRALLAVHGHEAVLKHEHLPPELAREPAPSEPVEGGPLRDRREHDLSALKRALRSNGGNISAAASVLGISRQRIYRLLDGQSVETLLKKAGGSGG
ncbi:MAG TPA: sigma 54-interacting transcriptional regulator [Polyangiaceae bacterium]|nr:sigma 54-interacting transcriptional regulator [Polyangiaceae bacterium]